MGQKGRKRLSATLVVEITLGLIEKQSLNIILGYEIAKITF